MAEVVDRIPKALRGDPEGAPDETRDVADLGPSVHLRLRVLLAEILDDEFQSCARGYLENTGVEYGAGESWTVERAERFASRPLRWREVASAPLDGWLVPRRTLWRVNR